MRRRIERALKLVGDDLARRWRRQGGDRVEDAALEIAFEDMKPDREAMAPHIDALLPIADRLGPKIRAAWPDLKAVLPVIKEFTALAQK